METTESLWSSTATTHAYPELTSNLEVDVLVVGGGLTGLTAAMLLVEDGLRVALVEARTIGRGVSHRSTVHATEMIDAGYARIESEFGREGARIVAASSRAAIETIAQLARSLAIACGVERRPGYLFTEKDGDVSRLRDEHDAARRAGLASDLLPEAPLPFVTRGALRLPYQLQFHVVRYLAGLASAATSRGASIFERSRVVAVEDGDPCLVHLEHGPVVRARDVLCATHAPLNRVLLQTKIAAYRSYVVAFRGASLPDGLFWDTEDPYHYLSAVTIDGIPYLMVGGEDHKTGGASRTDERLDHLLAWTRARLDVPTPAFRWSAQLEQPVDHLPFIGRNALSERVFVATGFAGNGVTFGTVSALLFRDLVLGRRSPWADLYSATRVKPISSAGTYVSENIDYPIHLVTDRLARPDVRSVDEVGPGEGKTVRVRGERLAVYRDPQGNVHALSAVCTHLGCLVRFNAAEKTWDCPCHGSRFAVDGAVLDGPATRPLARRLLGPVRHGSGWIERVVPRGRERAE